jgi:hypothetical protein
MIGTIHAKLIATPIIYANGAYILQNVVAINNNEQFYDYPFPRILLKPKLDAWVFFACYLLRYDS